MDQHYEIMEALKKAKERNNEAAMNLFRKEMVTVAHNELKKEECTIKDSLMKLNYSYFFEVSELNRVLEIINSVN